MEELWQRVQEVEHLGDEEEQHRFAEVPKDPHHGKSHARKIAEGVAHKHAGRIPAVGQRTTAQPITKEAPEPHGACNTQLLPAWVQNEHISEQVVIMREESLASGIWGCKRGAPCSTLSSVMGPLNSCSCLTFDRGAPVSCLSCIGLLQELSLNCGRPARPHVSPGAMSPDTDCAGTGQPSHPHTKLPHQGDRMICLFYTASYQLWYSSPNVVKKKGIMK